MSVIIDLLNQDNVNKETQEQLARTYFSPSEIAVKPRSGTRGPRVALLASCLVLLSILIFLSYALYAYTFDLDFSMEKKARTSYGNLLTTKDITLLGRATKQWGYISLKGDAKRRSGITIDLKKPMDLSKRYISLSALSKEKGGRLKIILRDKNYRSYVQRVISGQELKGDWHNFIIATDGFRDSIDIRNILHIRLELDNTKRRGADRPEVHINRVTLIDT